MYDITYIGGIKKMQKFPRRWDSITKINFLQRKIILNSIAYYEFDKSYISDSEFDELSHQLVEMQKSIPNIQDTEYGYMMYDFDGSTGFDLFGRLNEKDKEYLLDITKRHIDKEKQKEKPKKKGGRLF